MHEDKNPDYASTPAEIIDYYDSHLNLTIFELSNMTGLPIAYLMMHPEAAQIQTAKATQ